MKRALLCAALVTSCASSTETPSVAPSSGAGKSASAFQGLTKETGSPDVIAWVSAPWSFSTTSYAIVAPEGLILVDTQFLPKETIQFVDDVERATGKKAVAAIVLHANPDKFNGTAALQERGVRVVTSEPVAALIPAVHKKRVKAFGARYAPDYPTAEPAPETFAVHTPTTEMKLAGTTVKLHAVGPGCSAAHLVLQHGDDVFAGDLVANGAHAWLEIGETLEWQKRIDEMRALQPRRVHPGRGLSGGLELLDAQRRYLDDVIAAVAAEHPSGEPSDEALGRAKAAIVAKYSALRFAVFLEIGLPAEWQRQARLSTTKASEVSK
jgi:glyoxylase-like metal-dependent hydrolase (beta-lactamase superfamily II)